MNLGMPEMIFIFLLALLLFGPKKLPQVGRELGKALSEFKRASNEFKNQLETEIETAEALDREKSLQASPVQAPASQADTSIVATDGLTLAAAPANPALEQEPKILPPAETTVASSFGDAAPIETAIALPDSEPQSPTAGPAVQQVLSPEASADTKVATGDDRAQAAPQPPAPLALGVEAGLPEKTSLRDTNA